MTPFPVGAGMEDAGIEPMEGDAADAADEVKKDIPTNVKIKQNK